jgi:hypothetical protein
LDVDLPTATGWVACAGLRDKRKETVLHALQRLERRLPMPIRGLGLDNGTEFLSRELVAYCASRGITFTRSRPCTRNDNCHVEQKNWAVVRRLVGMTGSNLEEGGQPRVLHAVRGVGYALRA